MFFFPVLTDRAEYSRCIIYFLCWVVHFSPEIHSYFGSDMLIGRIELFPVRVVANRAKKPLIVNQFIHQHKTA